MATGTAFAGARMRKAAKAHPRFDFGGARICFRSTDAAWLNHVRKRFAPFACDGEPSFTVVHDLEHDHASNREAVSFAAAPGGFTIDAPGFSVWVDLARRTARVAGVDAAAGVDCLVKRLVPHLVERGLVLHAAAAAEGGAGVVLAGASGVGKSTIARLVGDRALCDELVVVRVEGESVRLESLPCWEARPGSARLAAIVLLCHGVAHSVRRLAPEDALRKVSAQVLWPLYTPGLVDRHLGVLGEVLARVPVFELRFAPRADVWDFLRTEFLTAR